MVVLARRVMTHGLALALGFVSRGHAELFSGSEHRMKVAVVLAIILHGWLSLTNAFALLSFHERGYDFLGRADEALLFGLALVKVVLGPVAIGLLCLRARTGVTMTLTLFAIYLAGVVAMPLLAGSQSPMAWWSTTTHMGQGPLYALVYVAFGVVMLSGRMERAAAADPPAEAAVTREKCGAAKADRARVAGLSKAIRCLSVSLPLAVGAYLLAYALGEGAVRLYLVAPFVLALWASIVWLSWLAYGPVMALVALLAVLLPPALLVVMALSYARAVRFVRELGMRLTFTGAVRPVGAHGRG